MKRKYKDMLREVLRQHPKGLSQAQLTKLTDAAQSQVSRTLASMMDEGTREVRICWWERAKKASGPPVAYYALGAEPDAVCTIPKLSGKERVERHRERRHNRTPRGSYADGFQNLTSAFFSNGIQA